MDDLDHILNLLDDPNPEVKSMVDDYILDKGCLFWETVKQSAELVMTKENSAGIMSRMSVLAEKFAEYIFYSDKEIPWLDTGLFCLEALYSPLFLKSDFDALPLEIAESVICEINDEQTAIEKTTIFNHIFFYRYKIRINKYISDNRSPALHDVFVDRAGDFPIVVVAYLLVARLAAIPIYPVILSDKTYVLAYCDNNKPIFLLAEEDGALSILALNPLLKLGRDITPESGDNVTMRIYCDVLRNYFIKCSDDRKMNIVTDIYNSLENR